MFPTVECKLTPLFLYNPLRRLPACTLILYMPPSNLSKLVWNSSLCFTFSLAFPTRKSSWGQELCCTPSVPFASLASSLHDFLSSSTLVFLWSDFSKTNTLFSGMSVITAFPTFLTVSKPRNYGSYLSHTYFSSVKTFVSPTSWLPTPCFPSSPPSHSKLYYFYKFNSSKKRKVWVWSADARKLSTYEYWFKLIVVFEIYKKTVQTQT